MGGFNGEEEGRKGKKGIQEYREGELTLKAI